MGYILGVDPGLSGALAVISPAKAVIDVIDTPTQKSKTGKRSIDTFRLAQFVDNWARETMLVVIEDVHAMPNQGVVSMFSFGKALGIVIGLTSSYNLPTAFVSPSVWKLSMGLGADKKEAILKANKLFPAAKEVIGKKDGRAEAILLAYYGLNGLKR